MCSNMVNNSCRGSMACIDLGLKYRKTVLLLGRENLRSGWALSKVSIKLGENW